MWFTVTSGNLFMNAGGITSMARFRKRSVHRDLSAFFLRLLVKLIDRFDCRSAGCENRGLVDASKNIEKRCQSDAIRSSLTGHVTSSFFAPLPYDEAHLQRRVYSCSFPREALPVRLCFGAYAEAPLLLTYCFNDGRASAIEWLPLLRWVFDLDGALSQ